MREEVESPAPAKIGDKFKSLNIRPDAFDPTSVGRSIRDRRDEQYYEEHAEERVKYYDNGIASHQQELYDESNEVLLLSN